MADFQRNGRDCLYIDTTFDLLPPHNRGWDLIAVAPAAGGRLNTGDAIFVAPVTSDRAQVTVMRGTQLVLSAELTLGKPQGQQRFHWLEGAANRLQIFVFRNANAPSGRARMHIEVFAMSGAYAHEMPWNPGEISYPHSAPDGPAPGDEAVPGHTRQEDEGSGEEPYP
jgi:hypothetical protein